MFRDNKRKPIQLNNKFTVVLLVTSTLFLLRTTFRLAEAIEGGLKTDTAGAARLS
jgi:hypothetical protein